MQKGTAESYTVFVRNWWRRDETGRLVPGPGPKRALARGCTFLEAKQLAQEYNRAHKPGPLSRKAELARE